MQLLKMQQDEPNVLLEDAVPVACHQRNRLRSVHGSSPYQIVFGHNPQSNGLCDEPHLSKPLDDTEQHQKDQALRYSAAKAFYEANNNQLLKRALLARPRSEHVAASLGDWIYYWRQGENKLDPARWRGPALVCAIEPRKNDDGRIRASVYWVAHGSSLVRVASEHIRAEVARERVHRLETQPDTAVSNSLVHRVRQALTPVQGPVRFLDLAGDPTFSNAKAETSVLSLVPPETKAETSVPPLVPPESPEVPMSEPQAEEEVTTEPQHTAAAAEHKTAAAEAEAVEVETKEDQDPSGRGRSRSPPPHDSRHKDFENLYESYNKARQLDGLPPVSRDDQHLKSQYDMLYGEEVDRLDENFMATSFSEKNLTKEQKEEFAEARDKALDVWFENQAWRPVDASEAQPGEAVPARFLQRWKPTKEGQKANARIIIQGFKHRDVLEDTVDKEAPTLSMVGRSSIYLFAVVRQLKLWSADVKTAFQQADNIEQEARVFIQPSAEIRRLLERKIGLKPWQIMRASKPAFGDCRAPRQWNATAHRCLTEELGVIPHPLDRCVYLSIRAAYESDPAFEVFQWNGVPSIVDGIFGLHVDDFIGAGEGFCSEHDLKKECPNEECFLYRILRLAQRFRFGAWDFGNGSKIIFCGAELQQSLDYSTISVSLANYVQKVKPISLDKSRKTMTESPCDEREHRQFRALIGALAWPAHQSIPELCASVSILQASASNPCVGDLNQANKLLRFAKEVSKDHQLYMRGSCAFSELCIGAYTDAAWAVRPDGSSQGGLLVFICSHQELESGSMMPLNVFYWKSHKLARICRSSLSSEAQAAAIAVDELEWCKIFVSVMIDPTLPIESPEALQKLGPSPLVTDAKSLFDAAKSLSPSMKLSEKRTAIEVAIVRDRMNALLGKWMWVNSHQQISDGLTKPASRDSMAYIMKRGTHQLKFNPDFTASKKVSSEAKKEEREIHEAFSKEMEEQQVFAVEEWQKHEQGLCLLPSCCKPRNESDPRNKYCSRRHFYAHRSSNSHQDEWKKAALFSAAILMASEAPLAEGALTSVEAEGGRLPIFMSFMVIMIFAWIGLENVFLRFGIETIFYKAYRFANDKVTNLFREEMNENEQVVENDQASANAPVNENPLNPPSHVVSAAVQADEVILNALTLARRPGIDSGSTTTNTESDLPDEEWHRWSRMKVRVQNEAGQGPYRRLLWELENHDSSLDSQTRCVLQSESFTTQRWRKFSELLRAQDTSQFSDEQVCQWHRMWNDNLVFLADVNRRIVRQRNQIIALERNDRVREQIYNGELADRICQTPVTFVARTRPRRLAEREHGAWYHVSDLDVLR